MIKKLFPLLAVGALVYSSRILPGEEDRQHEEEDREREEREREEHERDEEPDCDRHPDDARCSPYYMKPTGQPTPYPTFLYEHDISDFGETKLFSPDSMTDDYYGFATGVWEDTVVVGAYATIPFGSFRDDVTGSVFVYDNHDVYNTRLINEGTDLTYFGYSVAIWEDTILVGAPRHDFTNCEDCGGGFLYTRYSNGSWILSDILVAGDYVDYHYVGFSVALYEDMAIMGAPGDKGHAGNAANVGAAYAFKKNAMGVWQYTQKLVISSGNENDKKHGQEYDHFGSAVAMFGNYGVIGAYGDSHNTGAVIIFQHLGSGWSPKYRLTAFDGAEGDYFGYDVAIYNDIIVVGAYNGHGHWYGSGAAYVFEYLGGSAAFQQTSKLVAHDGMSNDFFGFSVAIFQNVVIVGAHGEEGKHNDKEGPRYRSQRKLPGGGGGGPGEGHQKEDGENCGPNSPPDCRQFQGKYSYRGTGAGAAYVFKRSGTAWGQVMKLIPSFSEAYDHFGVSVSTYNEEFIIGADTADGVVDDTGAVYVYFPLFTTDYDNERSTPPVVVVDDGNVADTGGFFGSSSTGTATFAFIVLLAPVALGVAYWYVQGKNGESSKDGLMQLPQDSRHGATVPWSMHGAFDESSWGLESSHSSTPAPPGTRSPLRAQANVVAR